MASSRRAGSAVSSTRPSPVWGAMVARSRHAKLVPSTTPASPVMAACGASRRRASGATGRGTGAIARGVKRHPPSRDKATPTVEEDLPRREQLPPLPPSRHRPDPPPPRTSASLYYPRETSRLGHASGCKLRFSLNWRPIQMAMDSGFHSAT